MNFWATGVRGVCMVFVCTLISVISLYSEITKTTAGCQGRFLGGIHRPSRANRLLPVSHSRGTACKKRTLMAPRLQYLYFFRPSLAGILVIHFLIGFRLNPSRKSNSHETSPKNLSVLSC